MIIANLDTMSVPELREFAYVTQLLMQYATLKAQAMEDREVGRISSAQRIENECFLIYHKLPKEYQW